MKFGQVIEYQKRNAFLLNSYRNEAGRLVPDLFFFLKKLYMRLKEQVPAAAIQRCSVEKVF